MALNTSGPISIQDINEEMGRAANAPFDMNGSDERAFAGVPTGSYTWEEFWGKAGAWQDDFMTIVNPNIYGTLPNEQFGTRMAATDTHLAVSNYTEQSATLEYSSGVVYVFDITNGNPLYTIVNPNVTGTSTNDYFGRSLAISDNYLAVTSQEKDGATNSGLTFIYNVTNGNYIGTIVNPQVFPAIATGYFSEIAITGTTLIGSLPAHYNADESVFNSGALYFMDMLTGNHLDTIMNPNTYGGDEGDLFTSPKVSGNYLLARTSEATTIQNNTIHVYNLATKTHLRTLENPNHFGTGDSDNFGQAFEVYGNYCVVSASLEDNADFVNGVGIVYIFDITDGSLLHTIENPNHYGTTEWDNFGISVAINSKYVAINCPGEDSARADSARTGVVYLFDILTGNLSNTFENPNNYGTEFDDQFGRNLRLTENYLIAGTPWEDDAVIGSKTGVVYIRKR